MYKMLQFIIIAKRDSCPIIFKLYVMKKTFYAMQCTFTLIDYYFLNWNKKSVITFSSVYKVCCCSCTGSAVVLH